MAFINQDLRCTINHKAYKSQNIKDHLKHFKTGNKSDFDQFPNSAQIKFWPNEIEMHMYSEITVILIFLSKKCN